MMNLGNGYFLRQAHRADHPSLYDICLRTGDAGKDATAVYGDPKLLGDYYAIPYQLFEPDFALVVEKDGKVLGYTLGALDTQVFYRRMQEEWLPQLRQRVSDPGSDAAAWKPGDWLRSLIHRPNYAPIKALEAYPSHAHIDLLPEIQGQGLGSKLMRTLFQRLAKAGSPGLHLGVAPQNTSAQGFYARLGFERIRSPQIPETAIVLARSLA